MTTNKKAAPAAEKKPVTPREDPVVRAERLLAEAKAKKNQLILKRIAAVEVELNVAKVNFTKWQECYDERTDELLKLRIEAGLDVETSNVIDELVTAIDDE